MNIITFYAQKKCIILKNYFLLCWQANKFFLVYLLIYRVLLFWLYPVKEEQSTIILKFIYGSFADIIVAQIVTFIACLFTLAVKTSNKKFYFSLVITFLQIFLIILQAINYVVYKFFFDTLDDVSIMFSYLKNIDALFHFGTGGIFINEITFIILIPLFCAVFLTTLSKKFVWDLPSRFLSTCSFFILLQILIISGLQFSTRDIRETNLSLMMAKNISSKMRHFFSQTSFDAEQKCLKLKKYFAQKKFLDKKYFLIKTDENSKRNIPQYFAKNPNIVFILLESVAAKETDFINYRQQHMQQDQICNYNIGKNVTPFLNQIIANSYCFVNFYANGNYTAAAQATILTSMYESHTSSMMKTYPSNNYMGMPAILKNHGYNTIFFVGSPISFDNQDIFAKNVGFDEVFGLEKLRPKTHENWAMWDREMFEKSIAHINKLQQPFFAMLTTMDNHSPYDLPLTFQEQQWDPNEIFNKYLNTVRLTDQSLEYFFYLAQKQPWYHNTLFVITSDNGIGFFPEKMDLQNNMALEISRHWVPLVFYCPGNQFFPTNTFEDTLGSHVDITPSILELLGISSQNHFVGKSLFSLQQNRYVFLYSWLHKFYWMEENQGFDFLTGKSYDLDSLGEIDGEETWKQSIEAWNEILHHVISNNIVWHPKYQMSRMSPKILTDKKKSGIIISLIEKYKEETGNQQDILESIIFEIPNSTVEEKIILLQLLASLEKNETIISIIYNLTVNQSRIVKEKAIAVLMQMNLPIFDLLAKKETQKMGLLLLNNVSEEVAIRFLPQVVLGIKKGDYTSSLIIDFIVHRNHLFIPEFKKIMRSNNEKEICNILATIIDIPKITSSLEQEFAELLDSKSQKIQSLVIQIIAKHKISSSTIQQKMVSILETLSPKQTIELQVRIFSQENEVQNFISIIFEAFVQIGEQSIPSLQKLCSHQEVLIRNFAIKSLLQLSPQITITEIFKLLEVGENPSSKDDVLAEVIQLPNFDPLEIEPYLDQPNKDLCYYSVYLLCHMKQEIPLRIKKYLQLLSQEENWKTRYLTIKIIVKSKDRELIPILLNMKEDPHSMVSISAQSAIKKILQD